jgi:hypothetical protein
MSISANVGRAAVRMAISGSREEEREIKRSLALTGILAAGADFGGAFNAAFGKIVETAIVAAKREGVISETHPLEGAVAGAAHDVLSQLAPRCMGFNVGGKIGIARSGEHLAVAIMFQIGLVHLDDIAIGVAHRAVAP